MTAPHTPSTATRSTHWLLALSLILIACNLRPVFGSLSVVLPEIMRDTGLSATGASVLTTLPILCLGVFSLPTPALSRRFGAERVLLLALLLIAGGTLLRAVGSIAALFASAVLAGAGIAMGNVLLPVFASNLYNISIKSMPCDCYYHINNLRRKQLSYEWLNQSRRGTQLGQRQLSHDRQHPTSNPNEPRFQDLQQPQELRPPAR